MHPRPVQHAFNTYSVISVSIIPKEIANAFKEAQAFFLICGPTNTPSFTFSQLTAENLLRIWSNLLLCILGRAFTNCLNRPNFMCSAASKTSDGSMKLVATMLLDPGFKLSRSGQFCFSQCWLLTLLSHPHKKAWHLLSFHHFMASLSFIVICMLTKLHLRSPYTVQLYSVHLILFKTHWRFSWVSFSRVEYWNVVQCYWNGSIFISIEKNSFQTSFRWINKQSPIAGLLNVSQVQERCSNKSSHHLLQNKVEILLHDVMSMLRLVPVNFLHLISNKEALHNLLSVSVLSPSHSVRYD